VTRNGTAWIRAHVFVPVLWQFVMHAFLVGCVFLTLVHLVYAQALPRTWLPALWIPLGFALQSGLVVALAARCSSPQRQLALCLDFLAWFSPLAGLLTARLGSATQSILLTLAIGCKLAVGLLVLHLAIRVRLSDRVMSSSPLPPRPCPSSRG
jgi:hypothetical protein